MKDILQNLVIRRLRSRDAKQALTLSISAGWNQTLLDWKMIISAPGRHFAAEYANNIVGTIATIDYDNFHWIAMVLVHPDYRRQGIATSLLNHVLLENDNHIFCLDATPAGSQVYAPLGFNFSAKINRWYVDGDSTKPDRKVSLSPLSNKDLENIVEVDKMIFGANRSYILKYLKSHHSNFAFKIQSDETNYIFGRTGYHALHIGPLVAGHLIIAKDLLHGLLRKFPGKPFYLDSFHNQQWHEELKQLGFKAERPLLRMRKNTDKPLGIQDHQFAIAGPELG